MLSDGVNLIEKYHKGTKQNLVLIGKGSYNHILVDKYDRAKVYRVYTGKFLDKNYRGIKRLMDNFDEKLLANIYEIKKSDNCMYVVQERVDASSKKIIPSIIIEITYKLANLFLHAGLHYMDYKLPNFGTNSRGDIVLFDVDTFPILTREPYPCPYKHISKKLIKDCLDTFKENTIIEHDCISFALILAMYKEYETTTRLYKEFMRMYLKICKVRYIQEYAGPSHRIRCYRLLISNRLIDHLLNDKTLYCTFFTDEYLSMNFEIPIVDNWKQMNIKLFTHTPFDLKSMLESIYHKFD